ncbi:MAG: permease-like cell division protein FtsX [Pseudomonadota bacterium]
MSVKTAIVQAVVQMVVTPFTTLLTLASLAVALSLPGGLYLLIKNVNYMAQDWNLSRSIALYLAKDTPSDEITQLQRRLSEDPLVERSDYISPEQGLAIFSRLEGFDPLLNLLDENPLPPVIQITPNAQATPRELQGLKERLRALPYVDDLQFDSDWVSKLSILLNIGRTIAVFAATLLFSAIVFLIGNSMWLLLEKQKNAIKLYALVGATFTYLCRPFVYRGIFYGLSGGLLACLMLQLLSLILYPQIQQFNEFSNLPLILQGFSVGEFLCLVGLGGLAGWLGAWLAVRKQWSLLHNHIKDT